MFKEVIALILYLSFVDQSKGWLFSRNSRCYRSPQVGCFPTSRPFDNTMGFAPQSPQDVGVHFKYMSSSRRGLTFTLRSTQRRMRERFNPSLKTVVLIHGFMEASNANWIRSMVHELFIQGSLNLFLVDWSDGANQLNYLQCVANARMAGAITALFLQELIELGASPSSIHVIGFSLGAHVAGYAGERVQNLGRITGLDPAGLGFHGTDPVVRLDPTDAAVVDVIHTDKELGSQEPRGSIDFYPNGGDNQPSCGSGTMGRLASFVRNFDFSRRSVQRSLSCSHMRATQIFTSSINNPCNHRMKWHLTVARMERNQSFDTCQDGACPRFGFHFNASNTHRPGIYSFVTSGNAPFC